MFAKILDRHPVRQLVLDQLPGSAGHDGLAAVSDSPEAGSPVDRRAVVVAPTKVGGPGMKGGANLQRLRRGPIDRSEPSLHRCSASERFAGVRKHDESAIPLATRPYGNAAVCRNRVLDGLVVLAQRLQHRIGRLFEHPGAALHVGKQERDDTLGKVSHDQKPTFRLTRRPVRVPCPSRPHRMFVHSVCDVWIVHLERALTGDQGGARCHWGMAPRYV